ncbi:hypothetical protein [Streptomyces sp. NPDC001389]|uniref:hypothetical protein n=1 Tax=Streptomyces sp. NPDC001389 TaxID=3364569 RepID=UPI0036A8EAAB
MWVVPPDPDRYPRETNEIARAAHDTSRRALRLTFWLGIPTLITAIVTGYVAYRALVPAEETNQREKTDHKEEQEFEAGSPVKLTPGESYYGPSWYVSAENARNREGEVFDMVSTDPDKPSFPWLRKHWTPLNSTGVAVNVLSKHKHTVLIQGVAISRLKCAEPAAGALFKVPPIGDGGTLEKPAEYAMNIEAARPVTRQLGDDGLPGPPTNVNVTLDQGDQREIRIEFFSGAKSCTFQAELIISSEGGKYKERLPAYWGETGEDLYTFRVTAPSRSFSYERRYATGNDYTAPPIVGVPADQIEWDKHGRPSYPGTP